MRDALTFSFLWTMGLGTLVGLPLTLVLLHSVLRGDDPPAERRARQLYLTLLEEELYGDRCFLCRTEVEADWLRCPVCTEALHARCPGCDARIKLHWSACPWCTSRLGPAQERRRQASRLAAAA